LQSDTIEYLFDFSLVFGKRCIIGRLEPFVFRFSPKGFRLVLDAHAVDYLLKPFDQKRFETAIEKARARLFEDTSSIDFPEIVSRIERQADYSKHISICQDGRIFLVKTERIEWIAAEKNYVRLYFGEESHLLRKGIGNIEEQLDPAQFRRVHRSAIVNINFIKELRIVPDGDYQIVLLNGDPLVLSYNYQKNLPEFLEK
jgi:two-component system LytT family response regulator